MELREAFDIADADKGGALELDEVSKQILLFFNLNLVILQFTDAFGEILAKNMNDKQLN